MGRRPKIWALHGGTMRSRGWTGLYALQTRANAMLKQIKSIEADGKTIRRVESSHWFVLITFTDDSMCYFQKEESWGVEEIAEADFPTDHTFSPEDKFKLGIITKEEMNAQIAHKTKEYEETALKRMRNTEQAERNELIRLKHKFENSGS